MSSRALLFVSLASLSCAVSANNLTRDINNHDKDFSHSLFIPYGFYNENTGTAAALVYANTGYFQPQATSLLNIFAGTNDTYSAFGAFNDFQLKPFDRIFVDAQFMASDWGEIDSFQNGNPDFLNEEAGTIDSDEDNFITANGRDNFLRVKFKYILPIGHAKNNAIHEFRTQNGLLVEGYEAGGDEFNPLTSGRTSIAIQPFYRKQNFEDDFNNDYDNTTSGVKVELEYDNTDWYVNPTYGSKTTLTYARDWGASNESSTWTSVQLDYSKYIDLGITDNSRQRVLALNFWTSDVPTWNSYHKEGNERVYHRAPLFEGSTLGGIDRQRGFSTNRFHNRSAINYSAEYRYTPASDPFKDIPLINQLHIPYWQVVGFAEIGSVADNWSISDLHHTMKTTVGAGIRLSVSGLVIRADMAASEEGGEMQMFFNHTF